MNYKDFKAAVALDANEPRDYEQIVFRTPDGTNYHNVTVDFGYWNNSKDKAIIVNLFNIKPKFKVGDVVCNNSGLYPNVKYTIAVVNEELQYYDYKEISGRTYFKDQDKLMLVEEIKPKFKAGDKVKGVSSENPEKVFTINVVNTQSKCYHYFYGKGIITKFEDQDKLTLVETDNSKPPVEDDTKLASTVKINSSIISVDVLNNNKDIYDEYTLFVQEMMCAIKVAAKQGHNKLHFDIGEKDINVFQLGQDFANAGYKVSAVITNDKNSKIDIEW